MKFAGCGIAECTFEDNIHIGDTFLFPVLVTLVLPSLIEQLKLCFKDVDTELDHKGDDAYNGAAVYEDFTDEAATIIEHWTINAVPFGASMAIDYVEKNLAVSYKEVALRRRMPFLRCGVLIHEGRCAFLSFPDMLEIV